MSEVKAPASLVVRVGLACAYLALFLALTIWGVDLWRTYCESFSCAGLGIAWLLWSAIYALVFGLGLLSYFKQSGKLKRILFSTLWVQALSATSLFVYWASRVTA